MRGRELRAILWLLPLLAVGAFLAFQARKINSEKLTANSELRETEVVETTPRQDTLSTFNSQLSTEKAPELFEFDPNTVSYHQLVRLGFTRGEALGIVKYRERGKIFEIAEDFAACYQVTEAMYRRLAPYIMIGEKFRLKKFAPRPSQSAARPQRGRTAPPNRATQNTVIPSERSDEGSQLSTETTPAERILVDLNTADTTALVAVSGIGSVTAARIVEYRARLGGFHDATQLAEVRGVTEQNFERILPQIFVDGAAIQKINVNFAPAKVLATHPYIEPAALRKLLKLRQLKGGWSSSEELAKENIFKPEQFEKLLPYLNFEQ